MAWRQRFAALAAAATILSACTAAPPRQTVPPSGGLDGHDPPPAVPREAVTVSGPSPFPDCRAGKFSSRSTVFEGAEVEPTVAVDPTDPSRIVGAFQQDRWSDGGARGIVVVASADRGRTWSSTVLPFSTCAKPGTNPARASDPWVSIGPDGTTYLAAIAVGDGVRIATSTDGGRTWPTVVRIPVGRGRSFADKPAVTADPTRAGVAYAVWNEDERKEPRPRTTVLSETTDGGRTWSTPKVVLPGDPKGGGAVGDQILVDPRTGALYHIYDWGPLRDGKVESPHVGIQVSTDGGATWSASRLIHQIHMVAGGTKTAQGRKIRSGAGVIDGVVDPATGDLSVAWEDSRFSNDRFGEVVLSRSADGGATWRAPRRVSRPAGAAAFTPMVAADSTGRLAVSFYALRLIGSDPDTDAWLALSTDGGQAFSYRRIDGPFDLSLAPNADGLFLGDYTGLDSGGAGFVALYAVTTDDESGPTDVRAVVVP